MVKLITETEIKFILTLDEKEAIALKGYLQNVTMNTPRDVAEVVMSVHEKLSKSLNEFAEFDPFE